MNRPFWLFFVLLFALVYGCGQSDVVPIDPGGPQLPRVEHDRDDHDRRQVKTPIVGYLLESLDHAEVDADQKDPIREMLYDADDDLHEVLGENSRNAILRANQKPHAPQIEPRSYGIGVPVAEEPTPPALEVVPLPVE